MKTTEDDRDLNPGFPPPAGRTPLAKVRTHLADRRSLMSGRRTSFARGRTGLAFIRTGTSFITISVVLMRVFGTGLLTIPEVILAAAGTYLSYDGLIWYLQARRAGRSIDRCSSSGPAGGTTVLTVSDPGDDPHFIRTEPVEGAARLRQDWNRLSPVMRRRFLASDRTDLAEERTILACCRTSMARARTGLSFTRTGIAFTGLGIALLRQFNNGIWNLFDLVLILTGVAMFTEGFHWYLPGRQAGREGLLTVEREQSKSNIWDAFFPPEVSKSSNSCLPSRLPVRASHDPGIWATTGLALERTVLAERRNVMARLRTVMARSRTGLALVRTGMSICATGAGLQTYFGSGNIAWTVFNILLMSAGIVLLVDGLYWHLPAEKTRRQYPYCFGEMEIMIPDYGRPNSIWPKVVFSHDDI